MSGSVEWLRSMAEQFRLRNLGNIGEESAASLSAAADELERLREALRWYEEKARDCRKIHSEGDDARLALDRDGGFRARAALGAQEEGERG